MNAIQKLTQDGPVICLPRYSWAVSVTTAPGSRCRAGAACPTPGPGCVQISADRAAPSDKLSCQSMVTLFFLCCLRNCPQGSLQNKNKRGDWGLQTWGTIAFPGYPCLTSAWCFGAACRAGLDRGQHLARPTSHGSGCLSVLTFRRLLMVLGKPSRWSRLDTAPTVTRLPVAQSGGLGSTRKCHLHPVTFSHPSLCCNSYWFNDLPSC